MLYWVLVEQAGHEHMSDEYKRPIYCCSVAEAPILGQPDNTRPPQGSHLTSELIKGAQVKLTNTDLPTCIVDRLLKLSCILLARIFY